MFRAALKLWRRLNYSKYGSLAEEAEIADEDEYFDAVYVDTPKLAVESLQDVKVGLLFFFCFLLLLFLIMIIRKLASNATYITTV